MTEIGMDTTGGQPRGDYQAPSFEEVPVTGGLTETAPAVVSY